MKSGKYTSTPVNEGEVTSSEKQETRGEKRNRYSKNIGSIRTTSGLFMLINFILLIMTLLMVATWRGKVTRQNKKHYEDLDQLSLYFIGSLLLPMFVFLGVYIKDACLIRINLSQTIASALMAFLCILSSVLILISAGYLIPKVGDRVCSDRRACPHLRGTMGCGIVTSLGVVLQGIVHLTEMRSTL